MQARESKRLISVLKRCLKIRGITYRDLALSMNLSESSVKRLFARSSLSLQRFEQVCEILGMSIFEISRMAREEDDIADSHRLSVDQERALAEDVKLLIGFHLILNGWDFTQIKEAFDWRETEVIKLFTTLDKLKLISLLPNNAIKTLTANNIRWRKDGPVRKSYQKMVFDEFMNDGFQSEDRFLDFEVLELSPASSVILKRKMELLLKEVNDLARVDYSLNPAGKTSTGIILAMRPWVLSLALDAMTSDYRNNRPD